MVKEYSYVKKRILRELSENSRISMTALAKKVGCSRNTAISNMNMLNKEFWIRDTINIDKDALGFQKHVIKVKCGKKPAAVELKEIFKDDGIVQAVMLTEGDFDIFIDIVVQNSIAYAQWAARTTMKLLQYEPVFEPSLIAFVHMGFIPVPNKVLKDADMSVYDLDDLDKYILAELNRNSRLAYAELAERLGKPKGTIRYRMQKIMKLKLIRGFTIMMLKPPTDYNVIFFVKLKLRDGVLARVEKANRYFTESERLPLLNRFQLLALLIGNDLMLGYGCFDSEEEMIRDIAVALKSIYSVDSPIIEIARIKEKIMGEIAVNNADLKAHFKPLSMLLQGGSNEKD